MSSTSEGGSRPLFRIEVNDGLITSTVYLRGEVDLFNAQEVRTELQKVAARVGGETLVIDLSELNYLSVSGVSAFVVVREHLAGEGRGLVLRNASENVLQTFANAGVADDLGVHQDPTNGVGRPTGP